MASGMLGTLPEKRLLAERKIKILFNLNKNNKEFKKKMLRVLFSLSNLNYIALNTTFAP